MLVLRQGQMEQLSLVDDLLPAEFRELPEDLAKLDAWLDDDRFFLPFLDRYHRFFGRPSIPAETYLRMAALQHQYDLSDRQICEWVRDRISWRRFCRIPWNQPVPHPTSLTKIRQRLDADGGDHMALLNEHLVRKASEEGLIQGRKVRVDTTAVEAHMHHPTDASLIADGVRVITRLAKRVKDLGGAASQSFQDRTRSIRKRLLQINKVVRRRTGEAWEEVRRITGEIADIGEEVLRAVRPVLQEVRQAKDEVAHRMAQRLEAMYHRTLRVVEQARRVNEGEMHLPDRLVSVFDPDARPIRRGKLHKPTEFGYKVRLTESEERIITEYQVFQGSPADNEILLDGVVEHSRRTGKPLQRVATDRGFWAKANEETLRELGIEKVSLPHRGKKGPKRREHEGQSWFRRLQRWRAAQEATISVLKRRYGLDRTLYRGHRGTRCWVGGAIWGYNLHRIAQLI